MHSRIQVSCNTRISKLFTICSTSSVEFLSPFALNAPIFSFGRSVILGGLYIEGAFAFEALIPRLRVVLVIFAYVPRFLGRLSELLSLGIVSLCVPVILVCGVRFGLYRGFPYFYLVFGVRGLSAVCSLYIVFTSPLYDCPLAIYSFFLFLALFIARRTISFCLRCLVLVVNSHFSCLTCRFRL